MRSVALISAALAFIVYASACSKPAPTPEDVVQRWQHYIDYNKFDSARLYSTELARSYIDFLDAITQGDTSEVYDTVLRNLQCDVQGDSAICHYLIEGEFGEQVPDTLILYKVKGQWLVHQVEGFIVIPVDTLAPGDERILFPEDSTDTEYQ
ncbi:MAG: hypothetical protein EP344_12335 [Bacteroidetes bacterium]|nr:MAG: hypothetical protein EP344_12335 [Bacteroidota bacterium]